MTREPFESIESAHGFQKLLADVVNEARQEIEADLCRESNGKRTRRMDAMMIASYQLTLLEQHVTRSARILNDLRTLRRLLFEERPPRSVAAPEKKPEVAA